MVIIFQYYLFTVLNQLLKGNIFFPTRIDTPKEITMRAGTRRHTPARMGVCRVDIIITFIVYIYITMS